MKNKGFTLAEILGVIVIITILLVLIIPPIMNVIQKHKDDAKDAQNKIIYQATEEKMNTDKEKYPNTKDNIYCITIEELIKEGFLTENLKDITTSKPYDKNKVVMVTITESNIKSFQITDKEKCSNTANQSMIKFQIYPSNKTWSQNKVVTIKYKDIPNHTNYYSKDGQNQIKVNGNTTKIQYNANGKIEAWIKGTDDIYSQESIKKIDTIKPICNLTQTGKKGENNWYIGNVNLAMTATDSGSDEVRSGVSKKGIALSQKPTYNTKTKLTRDTDTPNITYNGYVKDKAGNENKCQTTFKRDATKPICGFTLTGSKGNDNWYTGNIYIASNPYDATSGINKKGIGTNQTVNYNEIQTQTQQADTASTTYYCYTKDNAGNTNINSIAVKKDSTKPTIKLTPNTSSFTKGKAITLNINDSLSGIMNGQKIYYAWSKSNTTAPTYSNYVTTTNAKGAKNTSITIPENASKNLNGTYYLWIKSGTLSDVAGNKSNQVISGAFKFDNTAPTINLTLTPHVEGIGYYQNGNKVIEDEHTALDYATINFSHSDSISGIKDFSYSCTAKLGAGTNYDIKIENNKIKSDLGGLVKDAIIVTCTGTVIDNAGNINTATQKITVGNGWHRVKKCSESAEPLYGCSSAEGGGSFWEYYISGNKAIGWNELAYYNNAEYTVNYSRWEQGWYYFYTGEETSEKNRCYGPKYIMAYMWCKDIGGFPGYYYFSVDDTVSKKGRVYPGGTMVQDDEMVLWGENYKFDSTGKCVSANCQ